MALRVGVIGTGMIGRDHIRRLTHTLSGAKITAVTDAFIQAAHDVVKNENLDAAVYENGQELIQSDQVDAVIVTSIGETHAEYVLAAIAANKPVFCEKPLATTSEDCKKIVDAEAEKGRRFVQVGFMRRYDKGYRALKNVLDNDRIGAPLMVHCAHRAPSVSNFTGDMAITDAFVHEIDVLRWLLNDDYVSAQVILPRNTRLADNGLQDPHIMLLETKQGIRIDTEVFVNCQYGYDIQCQVVGETGTANLPEPASVLMRSNAKLSTDILTDWKDRFIDSYDVELQEWIHASLKGEVRGPSAWDGYMVAVTSDACVEAKHSGGIVPINIPDCPVFYKQESIQQNV